MFSLTREGDGITLSRNGLTIGYEPVEPEDCFIYAEDYFECFQLDVLFKLGVEAQDQLIEEKDRLISEIKEMIIVRYPNACEE